MECKNCSSSLRDEDGFCSYCGSRVIEERITLKFLTKELLDKVLSVDNRLLKTFWHLFSKPEKVIEDYVRGVRKKYVEPFTYLLISITLSGIVFYFLKDATMDTINTVPTDNFAQENPFGNKDSITSFINLIFDYQAFFTALMIPLYALISWVVFLNRKKYNFYEHIILFMYSSAQGSIATFFIVTPVFLINKDWGSTLSMIMSALSFIYISYILIRLFRLTFWQFIIKVLYFIVVSSLFYIIFVILALIFTLVFLGPNFFKELFNPTINNDSIPKIEQRDSIPILQKNDSLTKDKETISFYEASSKLNCLS